jgi:hypothetical protein
VIIVEKMAVRNANTVYIYIYNTIQYIHIQYKYIDVRECQTCIGLIFGNKFMHSHNALHILNVVHVLRRLCIAVNVLFKLNGLEMDFTTFS